MENEEDYPSVPATPSRPDLLKEMRVYKADAAGAILYGDAKAALRCAQAYQITRANLARLEASDADKLAAKINKMIADF